MRYATNIQLEQIIIHSLGDGESNGLELSERSIPLDDKQHLVEYFNSHIEHSLHYSKATAARFKAIDKNIASGICKAVINGSMNFVQGSQLLAKILYDIKKDDKRIAPGDLAIAFFKAGNKPEVPRYLAILKIDPSKVYRNKIKHDSEGKRYISLEIDGTAMPTTRERLQKCAFIQSLDPRPPEYDMIVLDQQTGTENLQMARFFVERFLDANMAFDDQKRTKLFYTTAIGACYDVQDKLQPLENELLRESVTHAVKLAHINVDSWISELPVSDEVKTQIDQKISTALPDREFNIDTTFAEKLTRKRIFQGDNDLRITVSTENFKDVISSVKPPDPEKGIMYYSVEIHTKKWNEVTR